MRGRNQFIRVCFGIEIMKCVFPMETMGSFPIKDNNTRATKERINYCFFVCAKTPHMRGFEN